MPQIKVPWALHERLWPIKYMIFLGLFGLSLYSLARAEVLAEVEPFKTAIILKFNRELVVRRASRSSWLLPGLFIERFFCRYVCPLGAALAIPARIADVRLAEALARMRLALPPLRQRVPGAGDPPRGPHQRQRVHLLHALPGALPQTTTAART